MNVKVDDLKYALSKNEVDEKRQDQIVSDLKALIEQEKDDTPKKEYRFVGMSFEGEDYSNLPWTERPVYIFKMEVSEDPNSLGEKFATAKKIHNSGKRNRKRPVSTILDVINICSAKTIREAGIRMVSKEPVFLVETNKEGI